MTQTNNNGNSGRADATLFVENRAQAAIFLFEMQGQISDGRWENSKPHNHHKVPCNAAVEVRPESIGRDFSTVRGYNFGEKELFECVGDRMTRFARVALAFPDVSIEALDPFHWDFDEDTQGVAERGYSADYTARKEARLEELFALVGVPDAFEFENKVAGVSYTAKDCRRDASRLTTCFRTRVAPAMAQAA